MNAVVGGKIKGAVDFLDLRAVPPYPIRSARIDIGDEAGAPPAVQDRTRAALGTTAPVATGTPLSARRQTRAVGFPRRAACHVRPTDPDCEAWNGHLVGLALRDADAFLAEIEHVPQAMREPWLVDLTRLAARTGYAPIVARQLRASSDPRAVPVAQLFERTASQPRR